MKTITQEHQQAARTAANSSAEAAAKEAADQKVLASLQPEDRKLVESLLADYPDLSAEKALAMLNEAGM
jgi:predicted RNA-binding protein Jag